LNERFRETVNQLTSDVYKKKAELDQIVDKGVQEQDPKKKMQLRADWKKVNFQIQLFEAKTLAVYTVGLDKLSLMNAKDRQFCITELSTYWSINKLALYLVADKLEKRNTLAKVKRNAKKNDLVEYNTIIFLIADVCDFFNLSETKTLSDDQIDVIAHEIINEYKHFTILDLALAFRLIKLKDLGSENVFDRLEPATFMTACKVYDIRKTDLIVTYRQRDKESGDNIYKAEIEKMDKQERKNE